MDERALRGLLESVREGQTPVEEALRRLATLPYADLGFARVDRHRHLRHGFPEVIFGAGKTVEQILAIVEELAKDASNVLVTRARHDAGETLVQTHKGSVYHPASGAWTLASESLDTGRGVIQIVAAGTSDLPVAEEAAVTARAMGNRVRTLTDVGVAGLHRLLGSFDELKEATVLVVVAGMEGALPSVVSGLVPRPVIAVPTSVGYGASFGGVAALLGMLNSCASGVSVVNIDNGFGAGYVASLINRKDPGTAAS